MKLLMGHEIKPSIQRNILGLLGKKKGADGLSICLLYGWTGQEGEFKPLQPKTSVYTCPLTQNLAGGTGTTNILSFPKIMCWALPMGQALFEVLFTQ